MLFKIKPVNISDIDTGDTFYRITTSNNIKSLARSINAVGLLNLPRLIHNENRYKIVSGFRRIKACVSLGWKHVEARVADFEGKELEFAKLAISDNTFQRVLNILEQSRSIKLLKNTAAGNESYQDLAENLGLPVAPSEVRRIETLCFLPEHIQKSLISEQISQYIALELGKLSSEESVVLTMLFEKLKMSFSKQKEILGMLKEIAARDDTFIAKILDNNALVNIIENNEIDVNSKVSNVRQYLKQLRFPSITEKENAFRLNVNKLKLNKNIKLIPPLDFEGTNYTISLNFKDIDELSVLCHALEKNLNSPYLKKILD